MRSVAPSHWHLYHRIPRSAHQGGLVPRWTRRVISPSVKTPSDGAERGQMLIHAAPPVPMLVPVLVPRPTPMGEVLRPSVHFLRRQGARAHRTGRTVLGKVQLCAVAHRREENPPLVPTPAHAYDKSSRRRPHHSRSPRGTRSCTSLAIRMQLLCALGRRHRSRRVSGEPVRHVRRSYRHMYAPVSAPKNRPAHKAAKPAQQLHHGILAGSCVALSLGLAPHRCLAQRASGCARHKWDLPLTSLLRHPRQRLSQPGEAEGGGKGAW